MFEEDLCERKFDVPFSYQPFTIAALKGFLEVSCSGSITFINAPYFIKDRKIEVEESKTEQFDKFNDLIVIKIVTDQGETTIAGTIFSDGTGRIVLYDKFRLDIVPEGTFLHFRIMDRPGVIGRIATILGNKSINIAGFGLSRQTTGEEIAFVSVDSPIDDDVLSQIQAIDGMIEASVIHL
jgi:D-3-phosphoglycerate dehydrogenase